ncbi:MAG: nucleoside deaminase [Oscillospiraceae bacterium]|nr:nucleoside deaminase [Oscillospiraceae bacterium]
MTHEQYMQTALDLAYEAMAAGEVPVGCVIVDNQGHIVGQGRNRREADHQATAHAEILAIEEACRTIGDWRLGSCRLYVTLEPCPMCAGAMINARIGKVFFGAKDPTLGAVGSVVNLFLERFGHEPQIVGGLLEEPCGALMTQFFQELRHNR